MKIKDKIEIIFWQDAYVSLENPEKDTEALTISIGHVTKEDDQFIHISHFFDGISGEWQDPFTTVPKGMVRKRYEMRICK